MDYVTLGNTGLQVSRFCLGCMNFGSSEPWQINDREETIELIDQALEWGINFFDTANIYAGGESESLLGDAIADRRDEVVLATKVSGQIGDYPNGGGLSRKHIMNAITGSLNRLGTDYVDLYYIHRWDDDTPIEETMATLTDLVKEGKIHYLGASTMASWQLMKTCTLPRDEFATIDVVQPEYNLINRHEEENLLPVARDLGLGVCTYSPLSGGILTGKYSFGGDHEYPEDWRGEDSAYWRRQLENDENREVVEVLKRIAEERDRPPEEISVAWLLTKSVVDSIIVGPKTRGQLKTYLNAREIELTEDEIESLEDPLFPVWFSW